MNPIEFDSIIEGQTVHLLYYVSKATAKNPIILYLHGWSSRPNRKVLELLVDKGYESMAVVFRGHEGSDGQLDEVSAHNALDDATLAYDELIKRVGRERPIVVLGSSYGSYIGVLLSKERLVHALSLRVPANYADANFDRPKLEGDSDKEAVMAWRRQPLTAEENRALKAIHEFTGRIQVIESGVDEQIPHQTVQNYIDAIATPEQLHYCVMEGWGHSFSYDDAKAAQYVEVVTAWLGEIPNASS